MSSRVARKEVTIPAGVTVNYKDNVIEVNGSIGKLTHKVHKDVPVIIEDNVVKIDVESVKTREADALCGTTRALINNMVEGVSKGFEKKLKLIGVGYRAQVKGKTLNLSLGLSHPVNHTIPEGVSIEAPSQTEIVIKSCDKQLLGQVAADIRAYRPPEPYKGKGIRYADEYIKIKETKK